MWFFGLLQLEYQRQELLRERQQFHMEQLRAAEFRAKQMAAQQLQHEQLAKQQQGQGQLPQLAQMTGPPPGPQGTFPYHSIPVL